jgi:hypothetical protein
MLLHLIILNNSVKEIVVPGFIGGESVACDYGQFVTASTFVPGTISHLLNMVHYLL